MPFYDWEMDRVPAGELDLMPQDDFEDRYDYEPPARIPDYIRGVTMNGHPIDRDDCFGPDAEEMEDLNLYFCEYDGFWPELVSVIEGEEIQELIEVSALRTHSNRNDFRTVWAQGMERVSIRMRKFLRHERSEKIRRHEDRKLLKTKRRRAARNEKASCLPCERPEVIAFGNKGDVVLENLEHFVEELRNEDPYHRYMREYDTLVSVYEDLIWDLSEDPLGLYPLDIYDDLDGDDPAEDPGISDDDESDIFFDFDLDPDYAEELLEIEEREREEGKRDSADDHLLAIQDAMTLRDLRAHKARKIL